MMAEPVDAAVTAVRARDIGRMYGRETASKNRSGLVLFGIPVLQIDFFVGESIQ